MAHSKSSLDRHRHPMLRAAGLSFGLDGEATAACDAPLNNLAMAVVRGGSDQTDFSAYIYDRKTVPVSGTGLRGEVNRKGKP